jgi:hypothetical protein
MAALRVAVNAPRDGEMRALSQALAASRASHSALQDHVEWIEARHDFYIETLTGENEELRRALIVSRARHLDVLNRFTMMEDRVELEEDRRSVAYATLAGQNEQLRRELAEVRGENERLQREANADRRQMGEMQRNYEWHLWNHIVREGQLLRAGARIARWVVQRCVAENVPVPAELRGDIALVHDDEINGDLALVQDDEAEGDVGMLAPDAVQ